MKHTYIETHQRNELKRERKMRAVRINEKTIIYVPAEMSDDEARQNYWLKQQENRRKFDNNQQYSRWKQ